MTLFLALFRFALTLVVLVVGTATVLVSATIPVRYRHSPLPAWVTRAMAQMYCQIFRVKLHCTDPERIRNHAGLIFPNHLTYVDSIALMATWPIRFLSAAENRNYPLVGWLAESIGTVFVARDNKSSRRQARNDIVKAYRDDPEVAIVLFPEGRLGHGDGLFPFRYGAFEIAAENQIPYLPCAIWYDRLDVARWRVDEGQGLLQTAWRLARYPGPLHVLIQPLAPVRPTSADDPVVLATAAQNAVAQAIGIKVKESEPAD